MFAFELAFDCFCIFCLLLLLFVALLLCSLCSLWSICSLCSLCSSCSLCSLVDLIALLDLVALLALIALLALLALLEVKDLSHKWKEEGANETRLLASISSRIGTEGKHCTSISIGASTPGRRFCLGGKEKHCFFGMFA